MSWLELDMGGAAVTDIQEAGVGVGPSAHGEQGKGPILASARKETIVGMTQTASLTAVVRQRYKRLHKLVQLGGLRRWESPADSCRQGRETRKTVIRGEVSPISRKLKKCRVLPEWQCCWRVRWESDFQHRVRQA